MRASFPPARRCAAFSDGLRSAVLRNDAGMPSIRSRRHLCLGVPQRLLQRWTFRCCFRYDPRAGQKRRQSPRQKKRKHEEDSVKTRGLQGLKKFATPCSGGRDSVRQERLPYLESAEVGHLQAGAKITQRARVG